MIGSYHIGFLATAQQIDGVRSIFEPQGVLLDVEFMDTNMGFEVETVSNGRDAIARLKSEEEEGRPFGLAIVDWKMPDMDGLETAQRILQNGLNHPPSMLMVTAHRKTEILEEALKAGFSSVLTKPVQPSSLLDAIVALSEDKRPSGKRTENPVSLHLKGAKVLLAEDNDINRDVALHFLADAQAIVTEARDGKEAVDLATKSDFDLILMDIQMPRMDGLEATRTIRSRETHRRTPIIAMTAHAMKGDRERCIEAGMDDHIPKPVDPDVLIATAYRWIFDKSQGEPVLRVRKKEFEESAQFPGIDLAAGLKRSGGDRNRYRSLLDKFIVEFFPLGESTMESLNAGNVQESSRLIHSMKGASATLGLLDVQRLSEDLENSIASGNLELDHIWRELQEREREVHKLLSCLGDSECSEATEVKGITTEEALDILSAIRGYLDVRQPRPILDHLESYRWPERVSGDINRLKDMVSRYRFKDAYSPLDSAIEKLGGERE
ncbi:response regulator [Dethiosulfovibrio salsuginis]|uniref:Two-component system, unclassified family, sensor histidine kinase and response regulator n=1 Tax=Dethiosulfovibrio salsuginis TaxID=561720 RepID=A0A1X7IJP4_9BACT|nr:response regulator [Dethiosulfovibrio salsuginis]SMG15060.1 two-component system, unclassified family, sensor histidine kinase and response regulator [Dethiosulfovibrio salsuginis]